MTRKIGEYVAALVEDGSTVELGIGAIPQAVLEFLKDKKDLGIHTEMFTDSIIDLIESGAVTGARKTLDRGKIVASFCMGTQKLYDYIDNNPLFAFHPTEYVNDPFVISQQHKQVAINVALEVDLTGQVCADSLGTKFYSGIGGQVDFNRGAARSPGGKAIIALPSTAKDGTISRIVTRLSPGAGVVTTRGDVHYVVTEYGVAYLHGKSVQERAIALISIAHPSSASSSCRRPSRPSTSGRNWPAWRASLSWDRRVPDHARSGRRHADQLPADPPDGRAAHAGPVLRAVAGDDLLPLHVPAADFPRKQIQDFVFINHRTDVAIVATIPEADGEDIIAIGRYYLDREDQLCRSGLRRARRLAEPGHRHVPARLSVHHRETQRDRRFHGRGPAQQPGHAEGHPEKQIQNHQYAEPGCIQLSHRIRLTVIPIGRLFSRRLNRSAR